MCHTVGPHGFYGVCAGERGEREKRPRDAEHLPTAKYSKDGFDNAPVKPEHVQIGVSKEKVIYVDSGPVVTFNGLDVQVAEFAHACNVKPEDKCWPCAFSVLPWPHCLRICQTPGKPGHESHDSSAHCWSELELTKCRNIITAARVVQEK